MSNLNTYSQTDTICLGKHIVLELVKTKIKKDSLEVRYTEKSKLLEDYIAKRNTLDSLQLEQQKRLEHTQLELHKKLKQQHHLKYYYALVGVVLGAVVFN